MAGIRVTRKTTGSKRRRKQQPSATAPNVTPEPLQDDLEQRRALARQFFSATAAEAAEAAYRAAQKAHSHSNR